MNEKPVKLAVGDVLTEDVGFVVKHQGRQNAELDGLITTLFDGMNAKDKQTKGASIMLAVENIKPWHLVKIRNIFNKNVEKAFDIQAGKTGTGKNAIRVLRNVNQVEIDKVVTKALGTAGLTGK